MRAEWWRLSRCADMTGAGARRRNPDPLDFPQGRVHEGSDVEARRETRSVRDPFSPRCRWDGAGVSGAGHAVGSSGGGQGPGGAARRGSRDAGAFRARGACDLGTVAPGDLHAVRRRGARGHALPRDGIPGGGDAGRSSGAWAAASRPGVDPRAGNRDGAGCGSPAGNRAPGPQARQRDADTGGSEAAGLRAGTVARGEPWGTGRSLSGDRFGAADGEGHAPRDAAVHGAGAASTGGRPTRAATSSRSAASCTRWRRDERRSRGPAGPA